MLIYQGEGKFASMPNLLNEDEKSMERIIIIILAIVWMKNKAYNIYILNA